MTTRGQVLLAKLVARDGANSRYEFVPETPDPIVALVKGDSVQEFIAKHEAARPKESSMSETKQSVWARIETAAAAVTVAKSEDGIPLTLEQATSAYLEQNPDEYRAWQQAPWAETVVKSEDMNSADFHLGLAVKKLRAERKAGLEQIAADMKSEADAKTAKKAAKGR